MASLTFHSVFCVSPSPSFSEEKKQVVFQCNLFVFLRAVWYDTCSCLLVLGLCFIVLIFQIKLLSVIHTDPGFDVDCLSDLCPIVCGDAGMQPDLHFMLSMFTSLGGASESTTTTKKQKFLKYSKKKKIANRNHVSAHGRLYSFCLIFFFTNFDCFPFSSNTEVVKKQTTKKTFKKSLTVIWFLNVIYKWIMLAVWNSCYNFQISHTWLGVCVSIDTQHAHIYISCIYNTDDYCSPFDLEYK